MIEWTEIRDHFKRERARRGLTQKAVASNGQLDQGAVSKIEADDMYTPTVITFLRAVYGLGYPNVSAFFHEIEQLKTPAASDKRNVFAAEHAKQGSDSVPAAAANLEVFRQFRAAIVEFLERLPVVHDAERPTGRPAAPRARRSGRMARRR